VLGRKGMEFLPSLPLALWITRALQKC
jgi:hypothetical protein